MSLSGEVAHPSRTVPRALVFALALVTALYVTVHLAAAVALGDVAAAHDGRSAGRGRGCAHGPSGPRRAACRHRDLDVRVRERAHHVHPAARLRRGAARPAPPVARAGASPLAPPAAAIATQTVLVFLVASSGTFGALASFASVAVVSVYLLACCSALQLQRSHTRLDESVHDTQEPFRVPAVVPIAGAAICVALLAQSTLREFAVVSAVLAIAATWYVVGTLSSRGRGASLRRPT